MTYDIDIETLVARLAEAGHIKPSRLRDVRSSAHRYAKMLGYSDPRRCPLNIYALSELERNRIIEVSLPDASPAVVRSIKSNVSIILKQAVEHNLITSEEVSRETLRQRTFERMRKAKPAHAVLTKETVAFHREPYRLPLEHWDAPLRAQYDEWKKWVTQGIPPVGFENPKNRRATVKNKTDKFEAFFGYLHNIRGIAKPNFEMLVDVRLDLPHTSEAVRFAVHRSDPRVGLLNEYVLWLERERLGRRSAQALEMVSIAGSVARKFLYPQAELAKKIGRAAWAKEAARKISELRRSLAPVPTASVRTDHRISRRKLLEAARSEFPQLVGDAATSARMRMRLAIRAGRAVALMLLVSHPLHTKSFCRARLHHNLLRDDDGTWHLHFTSDDEVAGLRGRATVIKNMIYHAPVSADVVEYLDQYLSFWRQRLVENTSNVVAYSSPHLTGTIETTKRIGDYVFLGLNGVPFTPAQFSNWLRPAISGWLGVRISASEIRALVAKEMMREIRNIDHVQDLTNGAPSLPTGIADKSRSKP